jgi:hypothetical protein
MMKPCIQSHTHTTRVDSSTRTGRSTHPSKTQKPGSSAPVAGMTVPCCACKLLKHPLQQDLSWTPFGAPDAASHGSACSCHVRHSPSSRQRWVSKDPRSQIPQDLHSVSTQGGKRNRTDRILGSQTRDAIRMHSEAPVRKGHQADVRRCFQSPMKITERCTTYPCRASDFISDIINLLQPELCLTLIHAQLQVCIA